MTAALKFVIPPAGLDDLTDATLSPVDGASGLFSLRSVTDGVRLYVLDAGVHLPDYQPVLSDEQTERLGLASADDALVLTVVNPGDGVMTVNLLAPIVVNTTNGVAAQVILEDADWPVRAPLERRAS